MFHVNLFYINKRVSPSLPMCCASLCYIGFVKIGSSQYCKIKVVIDLVGRFVKDVWWNLPITNRHNSDYNPDLLFAFRHRKHHAHNHSELKTTSKEHLPAMHFAAYLNFTAHKAVRLSNIIVPLLQALYSQKGERTVWSCQFALAIQHKVPTLCTLKW